MLKNTALNDHLKSEGYVVVEYFSEDELANTLDNIRKAVQIPEFEFLGGQNEVADSTFHITFLDKNAEYKNVVWTYLKKLLQPLLDDHFVGHRLIQTNIINKPPSTGYVNPHQNLTTVDEENFTSLSIWIPLQETTALNGALHVVPRSQGKFERFRNADICWPPLNTSTEISDYGMVPVPMKVGQILVFDDTLVHASPINKSAVDRLVFHALAIPNHAIPLYCHKVGNMISVYEVDELFWQVSSPSGQQPNGKLLRTIPYRERAYSLEDLMLGT